MRIFSFLISRPNGIWTRQDRGLPKYENFRNESPIGFLNLFTELVADEISQFLQVLLIDLKKF